MDLAPPRGTQDLMPPLGGRMRALYDRAAELARRYGYRYVETPGFEHTELFAATSGSTSDIVTKEMYTFEDRGGRRITLRPEGTAPVMRAYLGRMHDLPSPFKAYYLTRMYRYGRPQAGRYREHRQFGIEVVGTAEPGADVETIVVGDALLRSLGLARYEIQVNSIGDEVCRPAYREELLSFLRANRDRMRDEHRTRFEDNPLRVLDCKDDACRALAAEAPRITERLCAPCREHFEAVLAGLEEEGLEALVTPTLVRGLDYYTRTAGRTCRAWGSAWGSNGCSWRSRTRGSCRPRSRVSWPSWSASARPAARRLGPSCACSGRAGCRPTPRSRSGR